MKVAVTGSHGLIGSALASTLEGRGDEVVRLVHGEAGPGQLSWDPSTGRLDATGLEGVEAVVNLSGAGLGDQRWSDARKEVIVESRVASTELLAAALSRLDPPPAVLVSASAVGYYGDRGDEILTEDSGAGSGFLADLCRRWEGATAAASSAGIRVVNLRSGVVLTRGGGALAKQLPLFRVGIGGRLGSGRQYLSWITLDDEVHATAYALENDAVVGPVNAAAPNPVTNAEFTAALGRALHRPTIAAVPALALRVVMGREMTEEMLLAGQRAVPQVLEAAGYRFRHPTVEAGIAAALS